MGSFVIRDWKESRELHDEHEADPRYHRPEYIMANFKQAVRGDILYFMCICNDAERENAIDVLRIISSKNSSPWLADKANFKHGSSKMLERASTTSADDLEVEPSENDP